MAEQGEYEEKILALIREAVPSGFKGKLAPEMRLQRDLGLDSIAMLVLLFRFEQVFGISLAAVDVSVTLKQMRTVGEALAVGCDVLDRARAAEGV